MEYFKSTSKFIAEVKNGYVFVRNLEVKGGVIDALLTEKQETKISNILQQITDESFNNVWEMLMEIKGVRFDFKNN